MAKLGLAVRIYWQMSHKVHSPGKARFNKPSVDWNHGDGTLIPILSSSISGSFARKIKALKTSLSSADLTTYKKITSDILQAALEDIDGNQSEAAKLLGVSRITAWKWTKKSEVLND